MAREIMRQKALDPFILAERMPGPGKTSEAELLDYAFASCKTDHHPCGTCKMGTDALSVVDPDLKLHGIEGLRVCDASIMPSVTSSNTNAPTLMIAEKAADHILGKPLATPERIARVAQDFATISRAP
jgi:choline dehydrogenase-like flavoprotein